MNNFYDLDENGDNGASGNRMQNSGGPQSGQFIPRQGAGGNGFSGFRNVLESASASPSAGIDFQKIVERKFEIIRFQ